MTDLMVKAGNNHALRRLAYCHHNLLTAAGAGAKAIPFTQANFMALIRSAEGTPYRFGGIDPFNGGADCSGLIYWAGLQCGVVLPRSTQAEWAGLPHSGNWQACPLAGLLEFEVPADGGAPPQHVGVNVGNGFMIDDPHTGTVVKQEGIPNYSSIFPYGYCVLSFVGAPPAPPPVPPPPPQIYKPLSGRYGVLNKPVVTIVRRPQNDGYWEIAADGGIFAYGKAVDNGWSLANVNLVAPIIDAAVTPSGAGLVLVATDGGVFNFGDSNFYGSMGGHPLNAPIVSIEITESGNGYWCAAADGGVFCFGDAVFLGSAA